ncbi:MAG: hypothetical protein B6I36_04735 [Desulfobacteraceae bacterium 4572_35.1]|nr:MAG: hypothetical protein B6I36_04735 [Desulfobacteraceae bacterium 4572_35.1]
MRPDHKHLVDGKYTFEELVNIQQLKEMFERFSQATGFTTGLISYPQQQVLITTGWRDICAKFHRKSPAAAKHCQHSNIELTSQLKQGKTFNILPCKNGLVDGATPIIIKGAHVASLFTGQILLEQPNIEQFRRQASEYNFDEAAYLKALSEVPVVDKQKIEQALSFLSDIAILLAKQGLKELQQKQAEIRIQRSEKRYRTFFENSVDAMFINKDGIFIDGNKAAATLLGYSNVNELRGKTPAQLSPEFQADGSESKIKAPNMLKLAITQGSHRFVWNHLSKNGDIIPVEISATAVPTEHGTVVHSIIHDISERKQAMEQLNHLAHHHPLTGLPNRLLLSARLELSIQYAKRTKIHGAILFVDLDNFKKINDSLGHSAGDEVLTTVASRLREHSRKVDTVAHLSGDEFVVVLQNIHTIEGATIRARQIIDSMQQPFMINNYELFITCSIGIVGFDGDCDNIETLLQNADAAMHKAKDKGKNCYHLYSEQLTESVMAKVLLEGQLRRALKRNELVVHYQPQVTLPEGKIIAVEALLRWQHPEMGLVPPDDFIPLSEETGLIIPMGKWILETACAQLVKWRQQGFDIHRVAVNLSGRQLQLETLPQTVQKVLQQTGCPAFALELEITEGFIMRHPEQSIAMLQQIQKLGVDLSIDDFGTGHSSLNYLKRLPINRLKIDRSFVWDIGENINGETLTKAIIAMGHSLNLQITAEGIETDKQRKFLEGLNCNEAQGYLFSKPLPAEEVVKLLQRNS